MEMVWRDGLKFGGDGLCYAGDPNATHALHVLFPVGDAPIPFVTLVRAGRVATNAHKTAVFYDAETGHGVEVVWEMKQPKTAQPQQ